MTRLLAIPMAFLDVFFVGIILAVPPLGNNFGDRLLAIGAEGVLCCIVLTLSLATICMAIWGLE